MDPRQPTPPIRLPNGHLPDEVALRRIERALRAEEPTWESRALDHVRQLLHAEFWILKPGLTEVFLSNGVTEAQGLAHGPYGSQPYRVIQSQQPGWYELVVDLPKYQPLALVLVRECHAAFKPFTFASNPTSPHLPAHQASDGWSVQVTPQQVRVTGPATLKGSDRLVIAELRVENGTGAPRRYMELLDLVGTDGATAYFPEMSHRSWTLEVRPPRVDDLSCLRQAYDLWSEATRLLTLPLLRVKAGGWGFEGPTPEKLARLELDHAQWVLLHPSFDEYE